MTEPNEDRANLVYEARWADGQAMLSIKLDRPLDAPDIDALADVAASLGKLLKLLRPDEDPKTYTALENGTHGYSDTARRDD